MNILLFISPNSQVGRSTCACSIGYTINNNFNKKTVVLDINNRIKKFIVSSDDFQYCNLLLSAYNFNKFSEDLKEVIEKYKGNTDYLLINFPSDLNSIMDSIDLSFVTQFIMVTNATTQNVCNADFIISKLSKYPEAEKNLLINQYNLAAIKKSDELSTFQINNIILAPIIGQIPHEADAPLFNGDSIGKFIKKYNLDHYLNTICQQIIGDIPVNSDGDMHIAKMLEIIFDI